MLGIFIILLFVISSQLPIIFVINKNLITKVIVGWYSFGIVIGYIEFCMFINQTYMSSDNCLINDNNSWYFKSYPISDIFTTRIWADSWKEYCIQSGDFRYLETVTYDFVPWIELINAILAFIVGIFIIIGTVTNKYKRVYTTIAIIMISSTQIFGTIIYLMSYYTKCFYKIKTINLMWFIHLIGMNILWIIFPLILSVDSIKYIISETLITTYVR
tara:strand:- start:23 stop:670 length:648 start_codon:yes stop_codon:yes gene_type:complete